MVISQHRTHLICIHLICACGFCRHVHRGPYKSCPGLRNYHFRFSLRETLAYNEHRRRRVR